MTCILILAIFKLSADVAVGSVSNAPQYAVLAHLLAHVSDMEPCEFVYMIGDAHIYFDQLEQVKEQLKREPFPYPKININPEAKDLFKMSIDDVEIVGYQSHPPIEFQVAK